MLYVHLFSTCAKLGHFYARDGSALFFMGSLGAFMENQTCFLMSIFLIWYCFDEIGFKTKCNKLLNFYYFDVLLPIHCQLITELVDKRVFKFSF